MTKEDVKLLSGNLKWFKEWHGNNKPESILKEAVKLKLVTIGDGIATII